MHYASVFWACLMKLIRSGFVFLKNLLIYFSVIICIASLNAFQYWGA